MADTLHRAADALESIAQRGVVYPGELDSLRELSADLRRAAHPEQRSAVPTPDGNVEWGSLGEGIFLEVALALRLLEGQQVAHGFDLTPAATAEARRATQRILAGIAQYRTKERAHHG